MVRKKGRGGTWCGGGGKVVTGVGVVLVQKKKLAVNFVGS